MDESQISYENKLLKINGIWYGEDGQQIKIFPVNNNDARYKKGAFFANVIDTNLEFKCAKSTNNDELYHYRHLLVVNDDNSVELTAMPIKHEDNPVCDCKWSGEGIYKIKNNKQFLYLGSIWVKKLE